MNMILQDIESHKLKMLKHFKKHPNASISAMYRNLRNSPSLSFFGDYPIIAFIIETLAEAGIKINRSRILRATRQSRELKGRKAIVNALCTCEIAIRKTTQVVEKGLFTPKGIPTSTEVEFAYV